jgi:hypothetical protein
MTRALAQRLKPKGRLLIMDFLNDEGLHKFSGHGHEDLRSDTVAHKHGYFIYEICY